jgi:hypothetical protein
MVFATPEEQQMQATRLRLPEPVRTPGHHHLLDRHALGLGDEEEDEHGHDRDPASEKDEDAPLSHSRPVESIGQN